MGFNFNASGRRGPDVLMEELINHLLGAKASEFKELFTDIQQALKKRNYTGGGEEMMRLRTYEKLQALVRTGHVNKTGKNYKGVRRKLALEAERLRSLHPAATPEKLPPPASPTS